MKKSILIVDTPDNCEKCKFCANEYVDFCILENAEVDDASKIPDWCPLRPLPEKMTGVAPTDHWINSIKAGWNGCIDEITGGEVDGEIDA